MPRRIRGRRIGRESPYVEMEYEKKREEEILKIVSEVAGELGIEFDFERDVGEFLYDYRRDALYGDPFPALENMNVESERRGIRPEKELENKFLRQFAWHEASHGVVYKRLSEPLRPARYIPEEYYLFRKERLKFGEPRWEDFSFRQWLDGEIRKVRQSYRVLHRVLPFPVGIDCLTAGEIAHILYYHRFLRIMEEIEESYLLEFLDVCRGVFKIEELPEAAEKIRRICTDAGIKISEEICI